MSQLRQPTVQRTITWSTCPLHAYFCGTVVYRQLNSSEFCTMSAKIGTSMFGSVLGKPPASITSMVRLASSASRLANTDPAVPPPTAMCCKASHHITLYRKKLCDYFTNNFTQHKHRRLQCSYMANLITWWSLRLLTLHLKTTVGKAFNSFRIAACYKQEKITVLYLFSIS